MSNDVSDQGMPDGPWHAGEIEPFGCRAEQQAQEAAK